MIAITVLDLRNAIDHLFDDTVLAFHLLSSNPYDNLNDITINVEMMDNTSGEVVDVLILRD